MTGSSQGHQRERPERVGADGTSPGVVGEERPPLVRSASVGSVSVGALIGGNSAKKVTKGTVDSLVRDFPGLPCLVLLEDQEHPLAGTVGEERFQGRPKPPIPRSRIPDAQLSYLCDYLIPLIR